MSLKKVKANCSNNSVRKVPFREYQYEFLMVIGSGF